MATAAPPPHHPAAVEAPPQIAPATNGHADAQPAPIDTTVAHEKVASNPAATTEQTPATAHTATTAAASNPASPISPQATQPEAKPVAAVAAAPLPTKEELRNSKMYSKVTAAEAKAHQEKMKTALKVGEKAQKDEAHAAKMEAKARKELDAAVKKEYKLNKKLVEVKSRYDASVVALEKAKARLEVKEGHHRTQSAIRDEKMNELNAIRDGPAVKA